MNTPDRPETKDREHFLSEIEKIYHDAYASGEKDIAIVMATLRAALAGGMESSLAAKCAIFSRNMIDEAKKHINKIS
jgi:hypothetical protein